MLNCSSSVPTSKSTAPSSVWTRSVSGADSPRSCCTVSISSAVPVVHNSQLQLVDDAVGLGSIVLQNGNLDVVGVHLVTDGTEQQPMRFSGTGKIMHTFFVHREKLQRFLFFQKPNEVGFAVGLFAVVQHCLRKNKEVFFAAVPEMRRANSAPSSE